jgi:hypothetical protein
MLWLFTFVESKGWAISAVDASKCPAMPYNRCLIKHLTVFVCLPEKIILPALINITPAGGQLESFRTPGVVVCH